MERFLVLIDVPSIKQYVFGTDTLAEIRGASALLDHLNRQEMERILERQFPHRVEKVYANGGAAQFIVMAQDRTQVEAALVELARVISGKTGGGVGLTWGIGRLNPVGGGSYKAALDEAFSEQRWWRACGMEQRSVPTFPLAEECESSSYYPATRDYPWGEEVKIISEVIARKYDAATNPQLFGLWHQFVNWLQSKQGWPQVDPTKISCRMLEDIGEASQTRWGYIGLIYADGNAMGRLVQEISSAEVARAFSELVDGSLRDACHHALKEILGNFIDLVNEEITRPGQPDTQLPGDILLLGGDDLMVVLPAERAIPFAIRSSQLFEEFSRDRIQGLQGEAREFLKSRVGDRGLTFSCGVAIGPARYPFYLLLELAEELLASAKRGSSSDPEAQAYWAPSYIDFHIQAGSATQDLRQLRRHDYGEGTSYVRTLRPYRRERLKTLCEAAKKLSDARLPKSKLHDFLEAALEPRPRAAGWRAREIFVRLPETESVTQRSTFWNLLNQFGAVSMEDFPWTRRNGKKYTALADLVEVCDLFSTRASKERI
ncbi:MAG: hypothetical protein NZ899_13695 [Thermoguttaceae bacterium]|nr:hypothetical protein [Thermoguttaceae bacterium]